jgi:hypothetical protein
MQFSAKNYIWKLSWSGFPMVHFWKLSFSLRFQMGQLVLDLFFAVNVLYTDYQKVVKQAIFLARHWNIHKAPMKYTVMLHK